MAELWRFQNGTLDTDVILAMAMATDGSVVMAGYTEGGLGDERNFGVDGYGEDFAAVKLDANGTLQWTWQEGTTDSEERMQAVVMVSNNSVVLAGYTRGDYNSTSSSTSTLDGMVAVKLDEDGNVIWRWQGGTDAQMEKSSVRAFAAATVGADDSVVLAGFSTVDWVTTTVGVGGTDFCAVKLDGEGEIVWTWQNGTMGDDEISAAASGGDDGSVVLTGSTYGGWDIVNKGYDFAAVKLDADGQVLWHWQEGSTDSDFMKAAATFDDGAVVLAGYTLGSWHTRMNGGYDFAAIKLDANGSTVWKWQSGTTEDDYIYGATVMEDGSVVLTGSTDGNWSGTNAGWADFCGVQLSGDNGKVLWKWQAGTPYGEEMYAAASGSSLAGDSARVVLAGSTTGGWYDDGSSYSSTTGDYDFVAVSLDANGEPVTQPPSSSSSYGYASYSGEGTQTPIPTAQGEINAPTSLGGGTASETGESSSNTPVIVGASAAVAGAAVLLVVAAVCIVRKRRRRVTEGGDMLGYKQWNQKSAERAPVHPALMADDDGGDSERGVGVASVRDEEGKSVREPPPYEEAAAAATTSTTGASTSSEDQQAFVGSSRYRRDSGRSSAKSAISNMHVGEAVLEACRSLAQSSVVPGIPEAATLVSVLVTMATDNRSNARDSESRVRWCRSILAMLERASEVVGKAGETIGQAERVLLDDVRDSVGDLVAVMQAWNSKNAISKVFTSTLCKRRQEEAEDAIKEAVSRLQLGLQVNVVQGVQDVKDELYLRRLSVEGSEAAAKTAARRARRQRRLDQIEIPPDQLTLTDELLGSGGFSTVYLADYNGRNAAAKVMRADLEYDEEEDDGYVQHQEQQELAERRAKVERRAFTRELEAMIRLRSPYTVHVYGAVTSRKDRFILVMELLTGGDLRTRLKNLAKQRAKRDGDSDDWGELFPEDQARRVIRDICAGMAFLHSKQTVHGDLKSANVLFDGAGRAKIADFGTSVWTQHTKSTGLATYTTKRSQNTHMSFPWAAPEVLNDGLTSYASDVYSFGMVVWEVLTGEVPWSNEARGQDIYRRVVIKNDRPPIPASAPADVADVVRQCWEAKPAKRPTFHNIMESMTRHGWKDL